MEIVHCSFCKHGNPAEAKFCNACGSSLALQLCEACGAIDNISASACHKCDQPFPPRSGVAAPDAGDKQSVTPAAQAEEPGPRGRSPWKFFVLLALIVAGVLVIYPRVTGDEAPLSAIPAQVEVEAEAKLSPPPPDSPPADSAEAAPSEATSDTARANLPSTGAEPVEEASARPTEAVDEEQVEPPAPTGTTTEPAHDQTSAAASATQPAQAPAEDTPDTAATAPRATPPGCSPAIDALGLCK
jgi:hypothetical protein